MFAGASSLLGHLWIFAVESWRYAVLVILDYDGADLSVPVPRALCGDARQPPQGHPYLHAPAANRLAGAGVLSRVCGCGNHETHLHLRWIWLRGEK